MPPKGTWTSRASSSAWTACLTPARAACAGPSAAPWKSPAGAGLFGSRPVSRILSRVTIHLLRLPGSSTGCVNGACSPCTGRGFATRPCRQGRWWALTPPFHPYRQRLRRCAAGGLFSVPLSVGFRRLPRGSVLPFGVRTLLEPEGPRSPGLRPEFYLDDGRIEPPVQDGRAFGAADCGPLVQHELPAHGALERRAAEQREQLLLQRPVQGPHGHSSRNTPTTLPSTCT